MTFISRKVRLLYIVAVCCLLAVTGCTPETKAAAPPSPSPSFSPLPITQPVVQPKPKPTQKPLPTSIDKRSIAAAKKFGWAVDANKTTHKVRILHYDEATEQVVVTRKVGASFGGYHHDCASRTSCFTGNGQFAIYRKNGRYYKSSVYPKPHGGAPMPWATFFNGGQAFHFGNPASSHGCIHIFEMSAAKAIHDLPYGTPVIVHH